MPLYSSAFLTFQRVSEAVSHCNESVVYILDQDAVLCKALCQLMASVGLSARPFADLAAFIHAYQPERPACLLLDVRADQGVQQELRHQGIDLPVIVTAYRSDVATAVAAMKQGAMDFLEKPLNEQMLLDSVHHAITKDQGQRRIRARWEVLLNRFETLTVRELDILRHVAEGLSNRDIAEQLKLSHKTVEVHRAKVMQKMGARTLSQLIRMAMALHILNSYEKGD